MQNSKHILSRAVIALCLAWPVYDWFFVDEGPRYFASDWRRILMLATLSIGGGLATLAFTRLPDVARRRLTTASFAVAAVAATLCCSYFIWQFVRSLSFLVEMREFWILALFVLMGLGSLALLVFVWFSFCRYCQKIYGQGHAA